MNKRLANRILRYISENSIYDCSSSKISEKLKINRVTISKYLKILEALGEISSRNVGMAKLWTRSHNAFLQLLISHNSGKNMKSLMNALPQSVHIIDSNYRLYWANSKMKSHFRKNIDYKGRLCYEMLEINSGICINCPAKNTFKTGKTFRAINTINSNGNKIYFEMTSSPIKDPSNNIISVIEQIEPISKKEFEFKRNMKEMLVEI